MNLELSMFSLDIVVAAAEVGTVIQVPHPKFIRYDLGHRAISISLTSAGLVMTRIKVFKNIDAVHVPREALERRGLSHTVNNNIHARYHEFSVRVGMETAFEGVTCQVPVRMTGIDFDRRQIPVRPNRDGLHETFLLSGAQVVAVISEVVLAIDAAESAV